MVVILRDIKREKAEKGKEGRIIYDRPIMADSKDGSLILSLQDVYGVFPALHYMESYPDARKQNVIVLKADGKIEPHEGDEEYAPQLSFDSRGNTVAYGNYNFILLNDGMQHPISRVVGEFASFLSEIRHPLKRKVKIKDLPEYFYKSVERVARAKKEGGRGEFHYKTLMEDGCPIAMYIYAQKFSEGLRNRLGLNGRLEDSPLEERLLLE